MRKRRKKLIADLLLQLLVTGVLLVGFALPHHVIPRMRAKAAQTAPIATATPIPLSTPTPPPTAEPETEPTAETEAPDTRTEWQKKFAEHFTDEIIVTENSYSSPNVSITIEQRDFTESHGMYTVYYVADIYVGSIESFSSALLHDKLADFVTAPIEEAAAEQNAILAVNGDFACYQDFPEYSKVLRKGHLYRRGDLSTYQICVLFRDGTMETYFPGTYDFDALLERGILQLWHFGPLLINQDGTPNTNYDWQEGIAYPNPRTAVGYYEPGHYCYVVADGRQDNYSMGLRLSELAQIMVDMGCKTAYNLDGGASSKMYFNGAIITKPSNLGIRPVGDILYVCEPGTDHVVEEEAHG